MTPFILLAPFILLLKIVQIFKASVKPFLKTLFRTFYTSTQIIQLTPNIQIAFRSLKIG